MCTCCAVSSTAEDTKWVTKNCLKFVDALKMDHVIERPYLHYKMLTDTQMFVFTLFEYFVPTLDKYTHEIKNCVKQIGKSCCKTIDERCATALPGQDVTGVDNHDKGQIKEDKLKKK